MIVTVGKDGYLKVFDLGRGLELTTQRVPKPMARTNTAILDFYGTTRLVSKFIGHCRAEGITNIYIL